jgi:hypothetical protein
MKQLNKAINNMLSNIYTQNYVYNNVAIGDIEPPYIVFKDYGSSGVDTYASTSNIYGYTQQFDVLIQYIANSDVEADENILNIIDNLHTQNIEIENYNLRSVQLISQDIFEDNEKSPEGNPVYIASAIFTFNLTRRD